MTQPNDGGLDKGARQVSEKGDREFVNCVFCGSGMYQDENLVYCVSIACIGGGVELPKFYAEELQKMIVVRAAAAIGEGMK